MSELAIDYNLTSWRLGAPLAQSVVTLRREV